MVHPFVYPLAGAAVGGAVGGGLGWFSGTNTKSNPHDKLINAVKGATGGAMLGSSAGAALKVSKIRAARAKQWESFRDDASFWKQHRASGRDPFHNTRYRSEWDPYQNARYRSGAGRGEGGGSGFRGRTSRETGSARRDLGISGTETTKAEVKKRYHEMARKHHPDHGGKTEDMQRVNMAWDEIQQDPWFHKLAFWRANMNSFWNGFEKKAAEDPISKWETPAELAGLGTLMAPSIRELRGKPMTHRGLHGTELAGLCILAAPYAAKAGRWAYNKLKPKKPGV